MLQLQCEESGTIILVIIQVPTVRGGMGRDPVVRLLKAFAAWALGC